MRLTDQLLLHRAFRDRDRAVERMLVDEGIPLNTYEGARSPFRQAVLYARGRTDEGHIVTRTKPWESYHQYGLAKDRVFLIGGKWTWEEPEDGMWKRYSEIVVECGLDTLSFERPHCQMRGVHLHDLMEGDYPPDGGAAWEAWLGRQIELWKAQAPVGSFGGPPALEIDGRPPLTEADA